MRGSRRFSRFYPKERERNFFAAACSMVVIVILCTALAEPKWISMRGGGCNLDHLGVYQFFSSGVSDNTPTRPVYHYSASSIDQSKYQMYKR